MLYLNGKFIDEDKAMISVLEPGFLFSQGLFETMRAYNKNIIYIGKHLERLRRSCRMVNIDFLYRNAALIGVIERLINLNGIKDAYVRLTVWKQRQGSGILLMARKYNPPNLRQYKDGFSACLAAFRQTDNSVLTNLKTTNRIFLETEWHSARRKGFSEAIILNNRGYLCEGTRSSIFFVKDKEIFTPALDCGCLDGITRRVIFDLARDYNIRVYDGNFTLYDLRTAEEAFFANSLMGIMPMTSLERKDIGNGRAGRLTAFLLKAYNALLKNDSQKAKITF